MNANQELWKTIETMAKSEIAGDPDATNMEIAEYIGESLDLLMSEVREILIYMSRWREDAALKKLEVR